MRQVIVLPYQSEWESEYAREAKRLQDVFGARLHRIHHMGSTSVPGLAAKPIIDILPVVNSLDEIEQFNESMEALGYEAKGEFGMPGRRYFRKGGDERTHHIHLYAVGNPEIERHLVFRDYLRAHPEEANAYGTLKEQLAATYPYDIEAYIAGKDAFVKELEHRAIAWGNAYD
ncbi:GrpB family protein [Exiguobacterium acetylicum]|uniref:GrpB family protein n=1 Tax=Exiguobacterium acetylicum TaxID=41170 RepID=UPI001EE2C0EF|nr:GrpB family protein [Exiguobacterium acetylicum]UKS57263.1 GrpB family protein [Exiguobacterium acetylicum]